MSTRIMLYDNLLMRIPALERGAKEIEQGGETVDVHETHHNAYKSS